MSRNILKQNTANHLFFSQYSQSKFINLLMKDGKKIKIEKTLQNAFYTIKERTGHDPHKIFNEAIENVSPTLGIQYKKKGRKILVIPILLGEKKRLFLGLKWLIAGSIQRNKKLGNLANSIASELIDASDKVGFATKQRNNLYKLAIANRAYIQYRW